MDKRYATLSLASLLAIPSTPLWAAGFQLAEHSAAGLGRANAGEAAIADSAATIAHNSAAITRFSEAQISLGAAYIAPQVRVTGNGPSESFNRQLTNNDVVDDVIVPSAYFSMPINEQWHVGVGLFTDFGLMTEYPKDYLAGPIAGKTSLKTMNINPNVAYKINDSFSVSVGASAVYADAELERTLGILADAINSQNGTNFNRTDIATSLKGDGWGYGFNLGVLWELNENHRFGLSYRSKVDITLKGDYTTDVPNGIVTQPGQTVGGELELNLPSIAEFSGYHQVTEPLALHYSVVMTGWSTFEEIRGTVDGVTVLQKDEKFEDSFKYALGLTYGVSSAVTLRTGIAFDQTPNVNHPSISLPDSDRMNYSVGASYAFNDSTWLDFGFSFIDAKETTFTEELEPTLLSGTTVDFKSEGDAYLYAFQFNHRF
jgi:long-chain fatty acid transport protein